MQKQVRLLLLPGGGKASPQPLHCTHHGMDGQTGKPGATSPEVHTNLRTPGGLQTPKKEVLRCPGSRNQEFQVQSLLTTKWFGSNVSGYRHLGLVLLLNNPPANNISMRHVSGISYKYIHKSYICVYIYKVNQQYKPKSAWKSFKKEQKCFTG